MPARLRFPVIRHAPVLGLWLAALLLAPQALGQAGQGEAQRLYDAIESSSPANKSGLDAAERLALLTEASEHPVAKLAELGKYDPNGDIGFCFGRAMTTHLMARRRGLEPGAIAKLFIVGDLRSGEAPEWRFHVTTLVRASEDGTYYAIDPILLPMGHPKPLAVQDWIEVVRRTWDKRREADLYLTDAHTVIADMREVPAKGFETGERVFEISFDPANKPGFEPVAFPAPTVPQPGPVATVYRVSREAQLAYFLRTRDSAENDRFNFVRLDMKVLKGPDTFVRSFDFRNYFIDLLEDLNRPAVIRPSLRIAERAGDTSHPGGIDLSRTGMRAEIFE